MDTTPLHARNPGPFTGAGNWTWLLCGRVPTLIDAGTGDPGHLDELGRALGSAPLAQVLVTHAHPDHASGAPALAASHPGARFAKLPWPERDARWPVRWAPLAEGALVEAGDTTLQVIHTPGHAPDHVAFWHEPSRTLFAGDLVIAGATVWIPAGNGGDLAAYLASLERVLALRPRRLLPAHGPVIDQPERVLRDYLAHRRAREAQVLDALRRGDATVEAITGRVYGAVSDRLRPLACESVTAHLLKLERDGRAHRDEDAWRIV